MLTYTTTYIIIIRQAYKIGFYGSDVFWIITSWYNKNWWMAPDDKIDCSPEEMSEIVEASLMLGIDVQPISTEDKPTVAGNVSIWN